jgi:DNA-binding transcriptional LysR family regulator
VGDAGCLGDLGVVEPHRAVGDAGEERDPVAEHDRDEAIVTDEELVAAVGPGRTALDEAFAAAGLSAPVAFEAGDPRVLIDLAERGLGVAILPASAPEHLHALRISPRMRSRLELVWRAGVAPSPAAGALIGRVRRVLAADSGGRFSA